MRYIIIIILAVTTVIRSYGSMILSNITTSDVTVAKAEIKVGDFYKEVEAPKNAIAIESKVWEEKAPGAAVVDLMNPPFCIEIKNIEVRDTVTFMGETHPIGLMQIDVPAGNVAIVAVNGENSQIILIENAWESTAGETAYIAYMGPYSSEIPCAIEWLNAATASK